MSIPANRIVQILPSVEGATGNDLVLNGLMLTTSFRVPTGSVMSFADATDVGDYFGLNSVEYAQGQVYFNGFTGRSQIPQEMLVTRWTPVSTKGRLLGGVFDTLTIPQVQGINGTLTIVVDGYSFTSASINLSSATSYSAAAGLIQTALNTSLPAGAVSAATGATIAPVSSSFTGYISGNVLEVTSVPTNPVVAGMILSGTGVTASTRVLGPLLGATGGVGAYSVDMVQNVPSTTITGTYATMTLAGSNVSGTFSVGQTLSGAGVTSGTEIWQLGTGSGGAGTYFVSPSQTVGSGVQATATATLIAVTFDSQSGGLQVSSGSQGYQVSTMAFATGTVAASLFLTAQTGAVLSQGVNAEDPGSFMTVLVENFQNWANFWTTTDPDDGAGNGPGQKLLFSAWTSAQNNRYGYCGWDTDITPTNAYPATTSFSYQVNNIYNYSGTYCIYDPGNIGLAAFLAGWAASLNFQAHEGRTTMAFRNQPGLLAAVTQDSVYNNLKQNGYNFYGTYATANQQFTFFYPGSVSGEFLWADSYNNQIYMNATFQLDFMELLTQVASIPYNAAGAALMEGAVLDTINQMVNFGAIRAGVQLSSLEIEEVNSQSGIVIAAANGGPLFTQGWYFQVQQATPSVRQARTSPPTFFWYVDGQSVQQIVLNSIELL